MKLTAKFVENISEAGKYYGSHGLFLHFRASGAKKWLQRYTFNGRRREEIGLANAKVVSLATALQKAHQNLVLESGGFDPTALITKLAFDVPPRFNHSSLQVVKNLVLGRNLAK